MKKIIAFLLVVLSVLSFASCKKEDATKKDGIDISHYAKLSQIPECEYALGDDATKIIEKFEEDSEKDNLYYEVIEGDEQSKIFTSNAHYIYDNETKKVLQIVLFDKAYGYDIGTDKDTVINSQMQYDIKGEEVELSEEQTRSFAGTDECIYLEYVFDKSSVIFAFENNCLFATMIKINEK